MGEVKEEILNAIKSLRLTSDDIKLLDDNTGREIYFDCLNHFVSSGDRRWWWEDFKNYSFSIDGFKKPFEHLDEIIPNMVNNVWLIVEDDKEEFYPIFDCKPQIIKKLIGECFGFEYYIVSKDKKWLICENHHSRLIGTGEFDKLNKEKSRNTQQKNNRNNQ